MADLPKIGEQASTKQNQYEKCKANPFLAEGGFDGLYVPSLVLVLLLSMC